MKRFSVISLLMALAVGVAGSSTAWAQGFGLNEQGTCAMGRGGAGVASPCPDASAIFFNPAGLSFEKTQLSLGGAVIAPRGNFTDSKTGQISKLSNRWYPIPNIYYSKPMANRFAFGLGVFAPYGLTTDWPLDSQGRYLGYKSLVQAIYMQPTVAIKFGEKVSVGAGIDVTYLNVQFRQRVDLASQLLPSIPGLPPGSTFALLGVKPGTDFADVNFKANTIHTGYHLGVLIKANSFMSFGARYLSSQKVSLNDGKITTTQITTPYTLPFPVPGVAPAGTPLDVLLKPQFAAGGPLSNQNATTQIPLPDQIVGGMAIQVKPNIKLLADYQFTRWSKFAELPINGDILKSTITESYNNTHGGRVGVEIGLGPKSVLRAGVDAHEAAVPPQTVTPNLPEGWRQEYAIGFGRQLSQRFRVDAAYKRLRQPDRAGRTTNGGKAVPTTADNNGTYGFNANLLGMSLSMSF